MNLQPINPPPREGQQVQCCQCRRMTATLADLDGKPFESFYCPGCAPEPEHEIFGPMISCYSRAQAIEDGFLVDLTPWAREAGIKFPVACTRAVFEDCIAWPEGEDRSRGQSERGRAHDVLWMLHLAARRGGDRVLYRIKRIPRKGHGRHQLVTLKSVCGPGDTPEPVITIMQPEED